MSPLPTVAAPGAYHHPDVVLWRRQRPRVGPGTDGRQ
jgi:hypothetical protein